MSDMHAIEAPSVAAFAHALAALPHETRATVTALEHGTPWATVSISPMTDTRRAVFPNYLESSATGDTRKRGQCGASFDAATAQHALRVVIERARRMASL